MVKSSIFVSKISSNTKVIFEKKIVEALTEIAIGNTEEILTRTSLNKVENIDDDINITSIEKMVIRKSFKREVFI